MSTLMRSWSALLLFFSLFLAFCCWHRLLDGIFLAKGFGGYYVGVGPIETHISVEDQTWWSVESWIDFFLGGVSTTPRTIFSC